MNKNNTTDDQLIAMWLHDLFEVGSRQLMIERGLIELNDDNKGFRFTLTAKGVAIAKKQGVTNPS